MHGAQTKELGKTGRRGAGGKKGDKEGGQFDHAMVATRRELGGGQGAKPPGTVTLRAVGIGERSTSAGHCHLYKTPAKGGSSGDVGGEVREGGKAERATGIEARTDEGEKKKVYKDTQRPGSTLTLNDPGRRPVVGCWNQPKGGRRRKKVEVHPAPHNG